MPVDFATFASKFGGQVETPAPPASSFADFAKAHGGEVESQSPRPNAGLITPGTLDPFKRPALKYPEDDDGSTSSVSFDRDGKEILIPTTFEDRPGVGARRHTLEQSIAHYDKTGEHLGIFASPEAADAYATSLDAEQQRRSEASSPRRSTTWQEQRDAAHPAGSVTVTGAKQPPAPTAAPASPAPAETFSRLPDPDAAGAFSSIASQASALQGPGQIVRGTRDLAASLLTPRVPPPIASAAADGSAPDALAMSGEMQPTALSKDTKTALSDVIEGVYKTAQPVVATALAMNPVTTAIGLGSAMAADKAAREAVKALGGDEETQRLAGNTASLLAAGVTTDIVIRQAKAGIIELGKATRAAGDAAVAARETAAATEGRIAPEPTDIVTQAIAPTAPVDFATVAKAHGADVVPSPAAGEPPVQPPVVAPTAQPPAVVAPGAELTPVAAGERLAPPIRSLSPGEEEGIKQLEELQNAIHGEEPPTKGNGTFAEVAKAHGGEVTSATPTPEVDPSKMGGFEQGSRVVTDDGVGTLIGPQGDGVRVIFNDGRDVQMDPADFKGVLSRQPVEQRQAQIATALAKVDTLDTGEAQPRLPGDAGAVREQNVATPQIDAPFSLSGGVSERPTGHQGGLLDTATPEAQTSPRESVEQSAGPGPGEEGGPTDGGVAPSYPGRPRESIRQRETRRVAHYNDVFPHVLAAAQAVDPSVDPVHLRAEFDDRVNFLKDQHREFQDSGHDPRELLRAIAKNGGLAPESHGGLTGELRTLMEGNRGGAAAGVANVFRSKRQLDDRGVPVKGLPFDVMVQRLQEDPRFSWVENTDMLIDAIDDAIRHPAAADTFPGTAEIAKALGIDRGKVWWREKEPTGDALTAEDYAARAEIPTRQENWGSLERGQGKRSGGQVRGAMASPPTGIKTYKDYEHAKGVTPEAWKEIRVLEDEDKRIAIGALQAGLSLDEAMKLAYHADDASFNPDDFEGGGTGGAASMGRYANPDQVTSAPIPPKVDSSLFPPPPAAGGGPGAVARPVEFPELVDLARQLQGVPRVMQRFRGAWLGVFRHDRGIELLAALFKPGQEYQLASTLAHEIGHLVDWLPDKTLKRGNLLGRLRSLQDFLKGTFTAADGTTVKNADVRRELIALSGEWRPWNPETASESLRKYRNSGKELYADAISVLLNNPGMLAQKAPTFYKQFFSELDSKPEVQRAYFDLQEVLSGTKEELVARRRAGVRRMFEEGDVTALELEQRKRDEAAQRNENLWFQLKTQLVDKNYAVIDRVRAALKRGEVIPDDLNPMYFLEEQNYLGGQLKGFTERSFLPVFNTIRDAGIHWNAFGEALFYERIIAGDRSEVANPRGLSPTAAGELYESLKTELGPEKAATVRKAIAEFRKAVREIAEEAHKAGLYTDELHDQMVKNPAYVTFQVVDHLESGVTSKVYKSVGTLKDIVNPADSTILKTLVTLRAIEHQKVKGAVLDFLTTHYAGEITDAKTVWSGKGHRPIESKDPNQRLITYYDKGQLKGKYVDPFIADALENASIGQNLAVVRILRRINSGIFRPVFTTFNLGFQSFNFARDFQRFWKNTPGMTMKRALQLYWRAVPLARVRAFGVGDTPTPKQRQAQIDLIAAEESKMLSISFNDLITGRQVEDSQVEDILARTGIGGIGAQSRLWYTKPFLAVLDLIRELGDFVETLPKAAGVYEYQGKGSIKDIPGSLRSRIRRQLGSPDFLTKGTFSPVTNEVFLFSNAAAQAIRSDYEAATDSKTRSGWWWKTATVNLLPKLLMAGALAGLMGEELRRLLERASEYDRTNYIILPLGDDGKGNAVYVRMPQDQTGQLIGGVFWKFLQLFRSDAEVVQTLGQVVDYTAGQIPSTSPSVQAVSTASQLIAGQNPYDTFRGRNLFTDDEWKARDRHTLTKWLGWEFQQLGGGIVWKFYPGEERPTTETVGQRLLEVPLVSNIIGRFLRITNQGDTEALRKAQGDVQRDEARRRLTETEKSDDAIRTYLKLPADQQTPNAVTRLAASIAADLYGSDPQLASERFRELQAKLRRGVARAEADPLMDAYLSATSKAQKIAIITAWMKRKPQDAAAVTTP